MEELKKNVMYAIQNKRTKKFVYGTDFRYSPFHQRTSYNRAMTFDSYRLAEATFEDRKCGKDYKIVRIKLDVLS